MRKEEFTGWEESEYENIICPFCENRGYRVLLGPKILMPNEPVPEDYDQFLECPTCYAVIPLHETSREEEIKNVIETIDNPFDQGKIQVVGVERGSKSKRRMNKKFKLDPDPEIQKLLEIYGDRVTVLQDTDP